MNETPYEPSADDFAEFDNLQEERKAGERVEGVFDPEDVTLSRANHFTDEEAAAEALARETGADVQHILSMFEQEGVFDDAPDDGPEEGYDHLAA